jgi:hypothetical protein
MFRWLHYLGFDLENVDAPKPAPGEQPSVPEGQPWLYLREIPGLRDSKDDCRRLFWSDDFSLLLETDPTGIPTSFELNYVEDNCKYSIYWSLLQPVPRHSMLDEGECRGPLKPKMIPMVTHTSQPIPADLVQRFEKASCKIDSELSEFVVSALQRPPKKAP